MKKTIIILALLLGISQSGIGQTVNDLFGKYKHEKQAEYVNLSPFLFAFLKLVTLEDDEDRAIAKHIRSVCVLDMEKCSSSTKERFVKDVKQCHLKGYEELLRATDDGQQVRVLLRQKKDVVRDLVLFITGDDCTMIHIEGKIRKSDLNGLINGPTSKKMKHGS